MLWEWSCESSVQRLGLMLQMWRDWTLVQRLEAALRGVEERQCDVADRKTLDRQLHTVRLDRKLDSMQHAGQVVGARAFERWLRAAGRAASCLTLARCRER